MMKCYGKEFGRLADCFRCRYRKFCKAAADPPLLPREQSKKADLWEELPDTYSTPPDVQVTEPADRVYSRQELLEVIRFMVQMDDQTLLFLEEKLQHPEFNFADLARKHKISRQAVHKFIHQRCRKIPELNVVLCPKAAEPETTTTFLEEVCRIRQKLHAMRSKKPRADLRSLRRLTCSIQSLDLSKTSMFKGGSILKNV